MLAYFKRFLPKVEIVSTLPEITWYHVKTMAEINYMNKNWYCIMDYTMDCQKKHFMLDEEVNNYRNKFNITENTPEYDQEQCNYILSLNNKKNSK